MRRRDFIAITAGATMRNAYAQSAGAQRGAAKDLLYQGLELLSAHASPDQVSRALGFFQRALDEYASFGDAYYFRSLCFKRLQKDELSFTALKKAETYRSGALDEQRDPFTLAVPKIYDNLATVGQKWALVVGISRFQPDVGAESLKCPSIDANALVDVLRDPKIGRFPEKQVFSLVNEQATTGAIKARLNTIATKAKPEDIVLIYFSTHGSSRSDDIRQLSYIYTYDTNVSSRDDIFGTALPMVEISNIVSSRCLAERTALIFDTCHSGAGASGESLSSAEANRLKEGAGRYVLSSCEADQRSYENSNHGYFTASLIDHLQQREGCIRVSDLFQAVRTDVGARVMREIGKPQDPVIYKSEHAAEIVLGAAPDSAADQCTAKSL